ncbi:unnamed protein product [Nezara viridula]|uniref:Neuropeptide n=1 Tax=Nezara viridula TaxID=85310 RepID=A0A9P0HPF4_NEZVI|nr:unnamed protein product [Nezara viridula]
MCSLCLLLLALAAGCLGSCPVGQDCIKKCCPLNMRMSGNGCVPGESSYDVYNGTVKIIVGRPQCTMYYLDAAMGDEFTVHLNGSLTIYYNDSSEDTNKFCEDATEINSNLVFVCVSDQDMSVWGGEEDQCVLLMIYSIGLFTSAPLLLATAVIYASISVTGSDKSYLAWIIMRDFR